MNDKERAVIQQALEAIGDCPPNKALVHAAYALQEALDHSGEADEMVVGWDRVKPEAIASDPLYQQGFVDGVEEGRNQIANQAEQEPVACIIHTEGGDYVDWNSKGYCFYIDETPLYAAPVQQAEREPVAERKAQVNELIKESARLIASINDEGDRYLTAIDTLRNAYRLGLKDATPVKQEPVAWRCVIPRRTWSFGIDWGREYFEHEEDIRGLQGVEPLYAAPFNCKGKCCE